MKHTLVHSGPKRDLLHDSTMPSKALSPCFIHQGLQEHMLLFSMQQNRVTTALSHLVPLVLENIILMTCHKRPVILLALVMDLSTFKLGKCHDSHSATTKYYFNHQERTG